MKKDQEHAWLTFWMKDTILLIPYDNIVSFKKLRTKNKRIMWKEKKKQKYRGQTLRRLKKSGLVPVFNHCTHLNFPSILLSAYVKFFSAMWGHILGHIFFLLCLGFPCVTQIIWSCPSAVLRIQHCILTLGPSLGIFCCGTWGAIWSI